MFKDAQEKFTERLEEHGEKVLGLELVLAVILATSVYITFSGSNELGVLLYPVIAAIFVPFFSTMAYYRGFRKTGLYTIFFLLLIPFGALVATLVVFQFITISPSTPGLVFVLALYYTLFATAAVPYIILALSLAVHYYRKFHE